MKLLRTILFFALCAAAIVSCTKKKDTFQGNAEAYSGLRPKDGQYVWFDDRVSCSNGNTTETGYRGVLLVAGNDPIKFRAACSNKLTNVTLKEIQVTEISEVGNGSEVIVQYAKGLYDPSSSTTTPPATGTTRTWASFPSTGIAYEVLVRANGTVDNLTDARALVSSKTLDSAGATITTLLASIPVTSPVSTTDRREYVATDFSLVVEKLADKSLKATLTAKIDGKAFNMTSTDVANTFLNPPPTPPGTPVWNVAAGPDFTCVTNARKVWCTGRGDNGELGNGIKVSIRSFSEVPGITGNITAISAGKNHVCAIADGDPYCWGDNSLGQLGANPATVPESLVPLRQTMGDDKAFETIVAGDNHNCAITKVTKTLYCWGDNTNGQTGRVAPPTWQIAAVTSMNGRPIGRAALGARHTCVLPTDGSTTYCFGANNLGQLGRNSTDNGGYLPGTVASNVVFSRLYAGGETTCGTTDVGRLYCWGSNQFGVVSADGGTQHSLNTPITSPFDLSATINNSVVRLAMSSVHACAIVKGANVGLTCWGRNDTGQTGAQLGGQSPMPAFVVPGWGNVPSEISAGASLGPDGSTAGHTILIDTNRLMASGNNSNGEIGDNSTQMRETPVSVAYPQ